MEVRKKRTWWQKKIFNKVEKIPAEVEVKITTARNAETLKATQEVRNQKTLTLFSIQCNARCKTENSFEEHLQEMHGWQNTFDLDVEENQAAANNDNARGGEQVIQQTARIFNAQKRTARKLPEDPTEVDINTTKNYFKACLNDYGIINEQSDTIETRSFHAVKNMLETCIGVEMFNKVNHAYEDFLLTDKELEWPEWEEIINSLKSKNCLINNIGEVLTVNCSDNEYAEYDATALPLIVK